MTLTSRLTRPNAMNLRVLALALVGAASCSARSESPVPEPTREALAALASTEGASKTNTAKQAPANTFLGVILPRASADLAARSAARVRAVHVRLGDNVPEKGLIATLDVQGVRDELAIAEATLKAAEVGLVKAKVERAEAEDRLKRKNALAAESIASGEDVTAARFQQTLAGVRVDAASADIAEKRARVEQLRRAAAETEIRAPFAGIIAARYADPGATVTSTTPIVRLVSAGERFVRFVVPQREAAELSVGDTLEIRVNAGGPALRGVVEKVAPEVDVTSQMVIMEGRLDSAPESSFRSGEVARVSRAEPPGAP